MKAYGARKGCGVRRAGNSLMPPVIGDRPFHPSEERSSGSVEGVASKRGPYFDQQL